MENPKEDIIQKHIRDIRIKKQMEYNKKYLICGYKKKTTTLINTHKTEWYKKQKENKKNPFLRSNHGEFILTFN